VTQFEVRIQADRASDHPRVFTNIRVDYVLAGVDLDSEAVERAVELSKNKYCSVEAMLSPMVPIEHRITIIPAP
jgi:putative redox protein